VQTLQDRLKADETAIASQRDEITKVQTQLGDEQGREKQLSSTIALVASGLGALVLVVVGMMVVFFWPKTRAKRPETNREAPKG
jgi:hypothetical protein